MSFLNSSESKKGSGCYITTAIGVFIFVVFCMWVRPGIVPFSLFEFWKLEDVSIWTIIAGSWPLFAWGIGINLIRAVATKNNPMVNRNAEYIIVVGLVLSVIAGVFEEIAFRWIFFYGQIIVYKFFNFLVFGWAGFGVFQWLFQNIEGGRWSTS